MSVLLKDSLRWLRCGVLGFGLGLLIGSGEAVQIAFDVRLGLSYGQAVLLAVTAALLGGLLGLGAGLAVGIPLQRIGRGWPAHRVYTAGVAASGFLVSGFYLWNAAALLLATGRVPAAAAMAACPLGVAGVVWFNAGYWARRESFGAAPLVGWAPVSAAGALAICLLAAAVASGGAPNGRALAGDPNVLLITIDTLRRDHVGAYGQGLAETPRMDALAAEGVLFWDAVTPTPETAPAHASMMTALHPIRHGVGDNGQRLSEDAVTLAERLSGEGYATGAFLSSFAVNARTGLNQGFQVYEDDFIPFVRGASSILLVQKLTHALMILGNPADYPWLLERPGHATNALAEDWIRARGDAPWFAWVHYFEPHAPYEGPNATVDHRALLRERSPTYTAAESVELRRLYAYEVGLADTQVGELLDLLDTLKIEDHTLVIVVGDHGEQLGEHDIDFQHHGLYDQSLQIPLIIRAPGARGIVKRVIKQQVRLMDLAPTVLKWLHMGIEMEPSEGVPLLEYATGQRKRSLPTTLFGRKTASLSEGTLFGMRAPADLDGVQVDIKYIYDKSGGCERLYNLAADPGELDNIAAEQPGVLKPLREHVEQEMGAAADMAEDISDDDMKRLEAMGYIAGDDDETSGASAPCD